MDIFYNILKLLAGLGLFIYSIHIVSAGLEHASGAKLRRSINKLTDNKFKGVSFGFTITAILQSSTAAIAMLIGLVSAGIITLAQIFPIIIGMNLGSVLPMIFISFQSFHIAEFASVLCFIGAFMLILSKKNNIKQIGNLLIGIGLLFVGLTLMSDAVAVFKEYDKFTNIIVSLKNPLLLIFAGTILTALLQSSLASVAILIALYSVTGGVSALTLTSAAFIIYGINIGTSISNMLFSIGGNENAKRTTLMYIIFNVVGAVVMSIFTIFPWLSVLENVITNRAMQIVSIQIIFKIVTAVIMLPLAHYVTALSQKLIPQKHTRANVLNDIFVLNDDIFTMPSIALKQIGNSIFKLFELMGNLVDNTVNSVLKKIEMEEVKLARKREFLKGVINNITNYLIKVSGELSEKDAELVAVYHAILGDIRAVISSCHRLSESEKFNFTPTQKKDVQELYLQIKRLIQNATEVLRVATKESKESVEEYLINILDIDQKVLEIKNLIKKKNVNVVAGETKKMHSSMLLISSLNELENISENITNTILRIS